MAEEAFNVGDVVQLKSGGPTMTVTQVGTQAMTGTLSVWVSWFDGKKPDKGVYPVGAVKKV